jgi:hypothetical protein
VRWLASTLILLASTACADEPADPRFASPEATLESLLRAYGVEQMSQEEIQEHMRGQGRFELRDEPTYRECFDDYEGPQSEGLAGFVFGTVAAGKDQLRINHVQGNVHVFPNPDRNDRYVVLVQRDGEYKISLRESVPPEIRRRLLGQYQRMRARNQRAGASE